VAVTVLLTASCSGRALHPTELKLEQVLHQTGEQQPFGPGGLNQSFTVYELPKDVSATIAGRGLPYLNSLPSVIEQTKKSKPPQVDVSYVKNNDGKIFTHTSTGPYWAPFVIWNATPIPMDEKWLRRGRSSGKDLKPSIETFYAKEEFISKIPAEFINQFHEAISTPGNFYAYGFYRDMCLLVVSPKMGKAFYLFRD
jgi:hypothetical protein